MVIEHECPVYAVEAHRMRPLEFGKKVRQASSEQFRETLRIEENSLRFCLHSVTW